MISPFLTLQEAQGSVDPDPHACVLLSPIHHGLVGPVAEPHVGPDGSSILAAVQETDHQRNDRTHSLHVLPEHRELYLQNHTPKLVLHNPHEKELRENYEIEKFLVRGTADKTLTHSDTSLTQNCLNS